MNEFLTKITGLFSKDILFAAMLPAILFIVSIAGILLYILGFNNVIVIYNGLSANTILFLSFVSVLVLIVMAYVLHSIHDSLLRFWSGESFLFGWFFGAFEQFHMHRYRQLRDKVKEHLRWVDTFSHFKTDVVDIFEESKNTEEIGKREENDFLDRIDKLSVDALDKRRRKELIEDIVKAYKKYLPASLVSIYRNLSEWNEIFDAKGQSLAASLDREYGSIGTIKGTYLGNVIQSYNEYSYKRYRMEAEVFWPRLQKLMDQDHKAVIQDQRITLDFAVTCSTLSLFFAFICGAGPYLYSAGWTWLWLALLGLLISFLCYRMAIAAASTLGHHIRSSYDLFRLKLIEGLNLKFPKNTSEEQATWTSYSQFVTYGESAPLDLVKDEKTE